MYKLVSLEIKDSFTTSFETVTLQCDTFILSFISALHPNFWESSDSVEWEDQRSFDVAQNGTQTLRHILWTQHGSTGNMFVFGIGELVDFNR